MLEQLMSKYGDSEDPLVATIMAAVLVAFFAFLRKSSYCLKNGKEFDPEVHMTRERLIQSNGRYKIQLSCTKTIQLQDRVLEIWLPKLNSKICPHKALDRMLYLRKTKWHEIRAEDPLFVVSKHRTALSQSRFATLLRSYLQAVGVDTTHITPHSLRRGGTTFAFEAGCSAACIKMQGDWVTDAYLVYMCFTDHIKRNMIQTMEHALNR
jgi:integrase